MKTRIAFLAGTALGYVLGTRAGRSRYEQLKTQANNLWNDPKVQDGLKTAQETIAEKAPLVAEKTKEAAAQAVDTTKAKAEEVKENCAESKAQMLAEKAPADVVSDPETSMEDEGPLHPSH